MRRILTSIASFVSWHRRVVGALLAAAAVLLTVQTLKSPEEPTVTVTVEAAARWTAGLEARGLQLAPASAMTRRPGR